MQRRLALSTWSALFLMAAAFLPPLYALRWLSAAAVRRAPAPVAAPHAGAPFAPAVDAAGHTRRAYFPGSATPGSLADRAREMVWQGARQFGIDAGRTDLQLVAVRRSPSGSHVRLRQRIGAVPVWGAEAVVSFDRTGRATVLANDLQPVPMLPAAKPLADAAACSLAVQAVAVRGALADPPTVQLYWRERSGQWDLESRVSFYCADPAGDWDVWIAAASGEVREVQDRTVWRVAPQANATNGTGRIFRPDPVLVGGDLQLTDQNDADTAVPAGAYTTGALLDLATPVRGLYRLRGPWVSIEDWEAPLSAPDSSLDGTFLHYRSEPGFEDVMAYYHLDTIQRWYQSLGFEDANHRMQVVDPHGLNGLDNSKFVPTLRKIASGEGGVDDAEDAAVLVHEYGHATQFDIVPTWGTGGHEGAMGEGFGDYLANSYAWSLQPARVQAWNGVFQWDGHNEYWPGRRAIEPALHYPENATGAVHRAGTLWCSALTEALYAIGDRAVMDRLVIDHHYALTGTATMEDAANAILASDVALYRGSHLPVLVETFARWGLVDASAWRPVQISHAALDIAASADGPACIMATIVSALAGIEPASVVAQVRVGSGTWLAVPLAPQALDRYTAMLPQVGGGACTFEYYIEGRDKLGNSAFLPAQGSAAPFLAARGVRAERFEAESGWAAGAAGDAAVAGRWVRAVPVGTTAQPGADHTSAGTACFVTGNGVPGSPASDSDVDGGTTTLVSPLYDLRGAAHVTLSYWRWYVNDGGSLPVDDQWRVDASNDAGTTWTTVERTALSQPGWHRVVVDLSAVLGAPGSVRLRFVASDLGSPSIVEAALDDVLLQADFASDAAGGNGARLSLDVAAWRPGLPLRFALGQPGDAHMNVYDPRGRVVRELVAGHLAAGDHSVVWDGSNGRGQAVARGVYFVRLATPEGAVTRKILLVRRD